ncbi:Hypothetical predicted protein [Octopus vulgaris]|uniref:Uncharacterized protein n=1 Tax=Octopus vulgaris TaxID=6645 RepID=A0AA36AYY6_OCTVU|nr:Hypothetical predicted protein [Octopus vulgaris]
MIVENSHVPCSDIDIVTFKCRVAPNKENINSEVIPHKKSRCFKKKFDENYTNSIFKEYYSNETLNKHTQVKNIQSKCDCIDSYSKDTMKERAYLRRTLYNTSSKS